MPTTRNVQCVACSDPACPTGYAAEPCVGNLMRDKICMSGVCRPAPLARASLSLPTSAVVRGFARPCEPSSTPFGWGACASTLPLRSSACACAFSCLFVFAFVCACFRVAGRRSLRLGSTSRVVAQNGHVCGRRQCAPRAIPCCFFRHKIQARVNNSLLQLVSSRPGWMSHTEITYRARTPRGELGKLSAFQRG